MYTSHTQASNTRAGSPESALIMFDLLVQQLSGQTVVNMSSPIDPMLQLATSNTDTTRRALRTMFGNMYVFVFSWMCWCVC